VTGTFQDVPQIPLPLTWQRSQFAAYASAAVPGATVQFSTLGVYVEAAGQTQGSIGAFADLVSLLDDTIASTDLTLALSYGNPFPASYGVIGSLSIVYVVPGTAQLQGSISLLAPVSQLAQGPVVPPLSPPRDVTIGGKAANVPLSSVGQNPVIAWTAPAHGTPDTYKVQIYSLDAAGTELSVTWIQTAETSVPVPPGVLQGGTQYALVITADSQHKDVTAPSRYSIPGATADALTATFTP
jgi:hypothetical protein